MGYMSINEDGILKDDIAICPICGSKCDRTYYTEDIGLVEDYWNCNNCGYCSIMAYSPMYEMIVINPNINNSAEYESIWAANKKKLSGNNIRVYNDENILYCSYVTKYLSKIKEILASDVVTDPEKKIRDKDRQPMYVLLGNRLIGAELPAKVQKKYGIKRYSSLANKSLFSLVPIVEDIYRSIKPETFDKYRDKEITTKEVIKQLDNVGKHYLVRYLPNY